MIRVFIKEAFRSQVAQLEEEGRLHDATLHDKDPIYLDITSLFDPTVTLPEIPPEAVEKVTVWEYLYDNFRWAGEYKATTDGAKVAVTPKTVDGSKTSPVTTQKVTINGPSLEAVKRAWIAFKQGKLKVAVSLEPPMPVAQKIFVTAVWSFVLICIAVVLLVAAGVIDEETPHRLAVKARAAVGMETPADLENAYALLMEAYRHASHNERWYENDLTKLKSSSRGVVFLPEEQKQVDAATSKLTARLVVARDQKQAAVSELQRIAPRLNRQATIQVCRWILSDGRKWEENNGSEWASQMIPYFGYTLTVRLGKQTEYPELAAEPPESGTFRFLEADAGDIRFDNMFRAMEPLSGGEQAMCESALAEVRVLYRIWFGDKAPLQEIPKRSEALRFAKDVNNRK